MADETFAQRLQQVMRERGITKSELARRLYGTAVNTRGYEQPRNLQQIRRLLDENSTPQISTVQKVAREIGVPPSALMPELKARPGSGIYVEQVDEANSRLEVTITAPTEVVRAAVLILAPYAS